MSDPHTHGFDFGADGAPAIVVQVQADGSHTVHVDDRVCTALAAELLRGIADRLIFEHGPRVCRPRPERPRGADPRRAVLDRDRGVWHDPRGEAFDLTLLWGDGHDRAWRWHGATDTVGEPMLRAEDDGEVQPLGTLRAMYGPLSPRVGGAA